MPTPTITADDRPTLKREDGCDHCGRDGLGRPLRLADVEVRTPSGSIGLCASAVAQRRDALTANATVTLIDLTG